MKVCDSYPDKKKKKSKFSPNFIKHYYFANLYMQSDQKKPSHMIFLEKILRSTPHPLIAKNRFMRNYICKLKNSQESKIVEREIVECWFLQIKKDMQKLIKNINLYPESSQLKYSIFPDDESICFWAEHVDI